MATIGVDEGLQSPGTSRPLDTQQRSKVGDRSRTPASSREPTSTGFSDVFTFDERVLLQAYRSAHEGAAAGAEAAEVIRHEIQPGDTLSKLAERFNTTVERLAELNNIENVDLIYAGAALIVPTADEAGAEVPAYGLQSNAAELLEPVAAVMQESALAGEVIERLAQAGARIDVVSDAQFELLQPGGLTLYHPRLDRILIAESALRDPRRAAQSLTNSGIEMLRSRASVSV